MKILYNKIHANTPCSSLVQRYYCTVKIDMPSCSKYTYNVTQEEGTVKPAEPFDPKKDCEVLRKAMKGLGTDEDAIIGVWPKRTNAQRQELKKMYRSMYNKVKTQNFPRLEPSCAKIGKII